MFVRQAGVNNTVLGPSGPFIVSAGLIRCVIEHFYHFTHWVTIQCGKEMTRDPFGLIYTYSSLCYNYSMDT